MGTVAPARLLLPVRRKVAAKCPHAPTSLAGALFTTTQQRILALLFGQPNRSFFTKELIRLTGSGSGAVQRELQRLTSSGLAKMTPIGMQKYYQANPDCPVYHELIGMAWKTVALAEPVRQALEPLADRIKLAMIYGSVARGTDTAASDIDLLVAADNLMLDELYAALEPIEARLDRKLSPALYTVEEFDARRANGNPFLSRVLAGECLILIGSKDDASSS